MKDCESPDPTGVGLILLDAQLRPVQYNAEAASILGFPQKAQPVHSLASIFASHVPPPDLSDLASASGIEFMSGRRRYVCRIFLFDFSRGSKSDHEPRVMVVLERRGKSEVDLDQWSQAMHLTSREREAVELLLKGMTSREIAREMGISINTVTSFLSLVMAKVGASTRTDLLVKIFERAS